MPCRCISYSTLLGQPARYVQSRPRLIVCHLRLPVDADAFVLGLAASGIAAYSPPGPTEVYPASTCMCSSVLYSLLSACGVCQGFSNFDS